MEDYTRYLGMINNCDSNDPLLSETPLGIQLNHVYLDCLQASDLTNLTQALNLEQLIPTDNGIYRDYRGLAELMGFNSAQIETRFMRCSNPMKSLIDAYQLQEHRPSVNGLLKLIEKIERFDVIDDFLPTLIRFASPEQKEKRNDLTLRYRSNDPDRLTVDDTCNNGAKYDAFICYAPGDDNYARYLMEELWNRGKTVATVDDILPGHFEHDALMQLIGLRCRKVIIIVTRNFCRSKECEFQYKFASEVSIRKDLKIIPVFFEVVDDDLPQMLRYISKINLSNFSGARAMQFKRLISSLDYNPDEPQDVRVSEANRIVARGDVVQPSIELSRSRSPDFGNLNGSPSETIKNLTPEPIVELLDSQDSRAIQERRDLTQIDVKNFRNNNNVYNQNGSSNQSSNSRWRFPKMKEIFSWRKRDQTSSSNIITTNSDYISTSRVLLIANDLTDVTEEESIQITETTTNS